MKLVAACLLLYAGVVAREAHAAPTRAEVLRAIRECRETDPGHLLPAYVSLLGEADFSRDDLSDLEGEATAALKAVMRHDSMNARKAAVILAEKGDASPELAAFAAAEFRSWSRSRRRGRRQYENVRMGLDVYASMTAMTPTIFLQLLGHYREFEDDHGSVQFLETVLAIVDRLPGLLPTLRDENRLRTLLDEAREIAAGLNRQIDVGSARFRGYRERWARRADAVVQGLAGLVERGEPAGNGTPPEADSAPSEDELIARLGEPRGQAERDAAALELCNRDTLSLGALAKLNEARKAGRVSLRVRARILHELGTRLPAMAEQALGRPIALDSVEDALLNCVLLLADPVRPKPGSDS